MFEIRCPRCNSKISRNFDFCPHCGQQIKNKREPQGLLDEIDENMFNIKAPFGFNSLFKEIEKQFKELDRSFGGMDEEKIKKLPISSGISISISSDGGQPVIKVKRFGGKEEKEIIEEKPVRQMKQLTKREEEQFSRLPKAEPETTVRRLTDKIVYEINLPGVNSVRNISVNQLENSIEIRAFGKEKAFFKLIPLSLPLIRYFFRDGKLSLELKPAG